MTETTPNIVSDQKKAWKVGDKSKSKSKANSKDRRARQTHRGSSRSDTPSHVETDRWPFSMVWTPLPVITWFIPIIGHTGMADSKGMIHDFSDVAGVSVDNFSYGYPTKYYKFQSRYIGGNGAGSWDHAIHDASDEYQRTRYKILSRNCHQYIACVLNKVNYANRSDWSQWEVWWMITYESEYVDSRSFLRQWIPFGLVMLGFVIFIILFFA